MDGLISLLIIIGLFALKSSNKKKKAQQAARQNAFKEAEASIVREKIPFSKDEWTAFLKEQDPAGKKPAAKPEKVKKPAPARAAAPKRQAVPAQPKPAPRLLHDEPEGTISTQGETHAEHAEHRRKVLAEEAQRREEHLAARELREMNLEKLRAAVVMSEVLDKPVSLRPRGYR